MIDLLRVASCHRSMCFVVVSHVARFRETELPRILGRVSNLEALSISAGLVPKSCVLYTIPPNSYVTLENGRFAVQSRPDRGPNQSADVFFESLSRCCGTNSIGIILSGSRVGEDGSKGIAAIKKAGGHTYAQLPSEASFPDMPLAAIQTGFVDQVLTAEEIGRELSLLSWVEAADFKESET